jgi:hypothetical protein
MEVNSLWLLRPVQLYLRICPLDISRMPLGWDVADVTAMFSNRKLAWLGVDAGQERVGLMTLTATPYA